jgi:hypothetical protein
VNFWVENENSFADVSRPAEMGLARAVMLQRLLSAVELALVHVRISRLE